MHKKVLALFMVLVVSLMVVAPAAAAPAAPAPAPAPVGAGYHVVRFGETLFSIGRLYGVNPYAIAAANHLPNPNRIYAGQRLYIPPRQACYGYWCYCGYGYCNWR